jgi:hypothetical protein
MTDGEKYRRLCNTVTGFLGLFGMLVYGTFIAGSCYFFLLWLPAQILHLIFGLPI